MKFSELIGQEKYKPRPRANVEKRDAAIQRLTLAAHKHFEEGVQSGELSLLPGRSYIKQSELIEAAGGTWLGKRDSVLEDFNIDKDDKFVAAFFKSKRSYGKPTASSSGGVVKNPELRDAAREAVESLYKLSDKDSKADILSVIEEVKKKVGAYADVVPPLRGLLPK